MLETSKGAVCLDRTFNNEGCAAANGGKRNGDSLVVQPVKALHLGGGGQDLDEDVGRFACVACSVAVGVLLAGVGVVGAVVERVPDAVTVAVRALRRVPAAAT